MNSAIQTFTGLRFSPLEPDPAAIAIEDIAHGLAHHCRFGGHCASYFSVAQHCCVVSDAVRGRGADRDTVLYALLHDASEAYLGDLPHPVKHRSELGALYREIEEPLQAAILARFGLPSTAPPLVKEIDRAALAAERALLMRAADDAWWPELHGVEPLDVELVPWSPQQSETEFLLRFEALQ
jgi:5'-deoxynucleotidase YfbR-like HD superfamily hydrolase